MRDMVILLGGAVVVTSVALPRAAVAQCFVDSVNGDDANDGRSEATPVRTQQAIPSGCTEIRYRRGSVFNEAVRMVQGATTYTNYGEGALPRFVVPHTTNSGSLVSAYQGGITIDGLYLAGSKGDGTMAGLGSGVCVTIGGNSRVLNLDFALGGDAGSRERTISS